MHTALHVAQDAGWFRPGVSTVVSTSFYLLQKHCDCPAHQHEHRLVGGPRTWRCTWPRTSGGQRSRAGAASPANHHRPNSGCPPRRRPCSRTARPERRAGGGGCGGAAERLRRRASFPSRFAVMPQRPLLSNRYDGLWGMNSERKCGKLPVVDI